MRSANQTQKIVSGPLSLVFWGGLTAIVSLFLAFELLPLPQQDLAVTDVSFSQLSSDSQIVSLPDNWRSHPDRLLGEGTYRFTFDPPPNVDQWAVYIPNYSGQASVSLNGQELVQGGFISGDLIADQGLPFFAPIPAGSVSSDEMTLEITLRPGGKLIGFLSPIYVGPAKALKGSYDWHYSRAVIVPILVQLWQFLLAALLLLLWYSRKNERAALICGLLLLFSSLHGLPVLLPSFNLLADLVALFGYVTNFWQSVLGLIFVYELSERKLPIPLKYLFVLPGFATVAYLLLPPSIFHYIDVFAVVPFSIAMTLWIIFVLVRSAIIEKRWESQIIAIAILGACTLMVHDTLVILNVTPDRNFLHFRIVFILILPALSVVFALRLIESANQMDTLVETMEDRIHKKAYQLREAFERQNLREGQQVLDEERQRIMRDMHDGLGGQLMSIIAMSNNRDASPETIESFARAALDDLRTMINSLAVEDDITGILGAFRERAEQQLALQGIELDWKMIEIPPINGLTPSYALHIVRIMQEAVTNASKHSGADKVTILFEIINHSPEILQIEIADNGTSHGKVMGKGQGLKNMFDRADNLGGKLEVDFSDRGTIVCLWVPIDLQNVNGGFS